MNIALKRKEKIINLENENELLRLSCNNTNISSFINNNSTLTSTYNKYDLCNYW